MNESVYRLQATATDYSVASAVIDYRYVLGHIGRWLVSRPNTSRRPMKRRKAWQHGGSFSCHKPTSNSWVYRPSVSRAETSVATSVNWRWSGSVCATVVKQKHETDRQIPDRCALRLLLRTRRAVPLHQQSFLWHICYQRKILRTYIVRQETRYCTFARIFAKC